MALTWNAILLGTGPDLDTDESSLQTEFSFAGASVGTAANPISKNIYQFTVDDADGDNIWDRDNEAAPETASFAPRNGGTTETSQLDSVVVYNATITYVDGTTANITAVTFQLPDGRVFVAPEITANADDTALNLKEIQGITFNSVSSSSTNLIADRQAGDFVPCFVEGTLLRGEDGERAIETLKVGDLVETLDHGLQPVRWIGCTEVEAVGDLAPIEFAEGVMGAHKALRVSPQHRMLITDWRAEVHFGAEDVLVPAKALINDSDILRRSGGRINYWHVLFDRHEVVFANGVTCESFHPDAYAIDALPKATRAELLGLFPELNSANARPSARTLVKSREGQVLNEHPFNVSKSSPTTHTLKS